MTTKSDSKNGIAIFSQLPTIVKEIGPPIRKAIINCVHLLRNVDYESYKRISNWLVLQQAIGIDKIRFYDVNTDKTYVNKLRMNNPDLVEFVEYQTQIDDICIEFESYGIKKCTHRYGGYFTEALSN
jgi:hypothetical protein